MSDEGARQNGTSQEGPLPRSPGAKLVSYGLPCANCRAYYFAHLDVCPICGCGERIPANVSPDLQAIKAAAR